jgi:hypothetical protein
MDEFSTCMQANGLMTQTDAQSGQLEL